MLAFIQPLDAYKDKCIYCIYVASSTDRRAYILCPEILYKCLSVLTYNSELYLLFTIHCVY